jgi:hypothetical protein
VKSFAIPIVFVLAGCGAAVPYGGNPVPGLGPALAPVAHPGHADRRDSRMSPEGKASKQLMYVGDWSTDDVFVYDYPSGNAVGTLTGFNEPYAMCVDAKGDVYVANFGGGDVLEYAHGGTTLLNTYASGGEPIGCSVDAHNDLAVTSFDGGTVTVYAGGDPSKSASYSDPDCEYAWPGGYDDKGNLYAIGESNSIYVCELPKGAKTMRTVKTNANITIDFPGGVMWDGKYLTLTSQEGGVNGGSPIARVREGKDGDLTLVSTTTLYDNCYNNSVDVVAPFIVAKKNTPANRKEGYAVSGPNLWCANAGTSKVDTWSYPAGGEPESYLPSPPAEPYGVAVSIAP